MRWLAGVLLIVLLALQYRLWVGDGSLAEVRVLRDEIDAQKTELEKLRARNQTLEAEVLNLREGLDALEERARSELGMIKQGEIFLQVIEEPGDGAADEPAASGRGEVPLVRGTGSAPSEGGDLARREAPADVRRKD